jgi:hypothetical protein
MDDGCMDRVRCHHPRRICDFHYPPALHPSARARPSCGTSPARLPTSTHGHGASRWPAWCSPTVAVPCT